MLKLFIGNKAYSSWSMRGWLAAKQSGLPFEELLVPLYDDAWNEARKAAHYAPSSGKVPILWDGDVAVWQSLSIIEYLAEKAGQERFWPKDSAARAAARSIATEMQSGFMALRRNHCMNIRQRYETAPLLTEVAEDCERIFHFGQTRAPVLAVQVIFFFGEFGAVDIMFAPVLTRFNTYSIPLPRFAQAYSDAVYAHPFMQDWIAGAQAEDWVIERFEQPHV